jgi:Glycosyl hydrolase family 48/Cellulose binding domain/Putative Ig domain
MRMTNRPPRSRMLASILAAAALLSGAVLTASGSASAATAHAAAARLSAKASQAAAKAPLAGAPITSPTPNQVFTPGSDVSLQASPFPVSDSIKDGLTSSPVTSVAFYASTNLSNNVLVGTAKSAPWTVDWADVPAGDYSLTAVTKDQAGASTTSDPVAIQVEKPSVVTDQSSLTVQKGQSSSVGVSLSTAPTSDVTVNLGDSGTGSSVSKGQTLTFTPSDWNKPQQATVVAAQAKTGSQSKITASASGLGSASVAVTDAATTSGYDAWFISLYDDITNPSNGYFSPLGIPYHSVEELIVEAPDYGHETTSETYSEWLWLAADYGRVSGSWTEFNTAWSNMAEYMIPDAAEQPGCSAYTPSDPATYGPEAASPSDYPVALNSSVPVGSDPLYAELNTTYGNCDIYAPMWIMDTDNRYGFGQEENGTSTPSWINSYQRGSEESVWDTIPQPDWDTLTDGESGSGYLDLFNNGGGSFAPQYKYTDAPDADARLIQAAYWAQQYATSQGAESQISSTLADAAKLGDYLRYSMYDKYFKQISSACSQDGSVACPAGTSKSNEETYLLSWYYAWGGSTTAAWSWRISGTDIHEGYQNPMAAFALSTDSTLVPLSPSAQSDWSTSLTTQLNMMQWLQSSQGAIAGGITNNWNGNYGDAGKPPSGDATFDGMYYTSDPEYQNPPSNQWFGYQTWPMERVAEYYYVTGNAQAGAILSKWVSWAESVATFNTTTGAICLPNVMTWTGQPSENWTTGTSGSSDPPANTSLDVSVSGCSSDLGVSGSLAKVYAYYAAKSGNTTAETDAQNIIDVIHQFYGDSLGYSAPETRADYSNFTSAFNTTNYEGVYIPSGWSGTYPGVSGDITSADNTFLSIRPWYTSVADYDEVQNYLNGGPAPVFNYHRFWEESEIATAFDSFAYLFPSVSPPTSATPTVTVTNPGTQTGTVGTADTLQIKATDSASGKTFTYSATDLPIGLSISSSTGAITGTPTMAGSFTTTVTVNDGSGAASVNFDWTISATSSGNTVTVTNPGSQTGTVGTAASLQIKATDSATGQTLTYTAAGLPAGLSISSATGLISGTPTTAGSSSVTVTVTDGTGAKGTASFTWTVSSASTGNTVTVTNPGSQTGTVGTAASLQIKATDSATGQTLTYTATGLPAGLSISSSTGLISGTPTTAGTSSVTVTVTDTTGAKGTAAFTWTISSATSGSGSCEVTYTPDQWQGGFTADITIANTGSTTINGWTLTFTFPGNQSITDAWNGVATQTGENVSIANESYNATIAPGASTSLGFQGTWTTSDATPTAFSVNGTACTT